MTNYDFVDEGLYSAENLTDKMKEAIVRVKSNSYTSLGDVPITQADVESAMQKVDIQGLIDNEKKKYTIREYDGGGLGELNDEELRERNDITGDTAYLLETDSGKTFFQPFVPYVGGKQPLNSDNWKGVAEEQVKREARQKAFGKVLADLKDYVDY